MCTVCYVITIYTCLYMWIPYFYSFDIRPEISRGEIRDIWSTFILNQDRSLEWHQFVRHFGFSLRSAAFPNAKVNPPKRGDADFMMRSKKLNSAADMLMDSLRSKVGTVKWVIFAGFISTIFTIC